MATTTSSGQAHYVEFDEYVDSKIAKTREAIRSADIMVALVAAAAAVLGYLLLFVIADHWLGMDFVPPLARLVLGCSILGGSIIWAIWRIGLPNRRRINRLYVAREIEQHESALEGNLLNLVDLQQADRRIGLPVMRSIEKRAAVGLSKTDLDDTVDRSLLMRSSYTLLTLVVAACLYTLLTVSLGLKPIGPSLMRAFGASATAPTRIQFESVQTQIADGDSFVDADSAPRVPARFQPMIQTTLNKAIDRDEHVTLYFTTADQRFVDEPLEMRPVEGSLQEVYPEYSVTLLGENERGLLQDLTFRIEAGDAVTPNYSIQVSTAPSATVVSVDYDFPNYMRLEDESRDSPNVEGWEGTNVTVHAKTSQPVQSARLVFSDTEDTSQRAEEYPMHVTDGTKLSAAWHLAFRDGDPENYPRFYRIVCRDEQGATDLHPTLHSIAIRPDLPPEIELLDPTGDLTLPANAVLPLLVKARDPDFQLKLLTLRVELDGKTLVEHNRELFSGEQPSFGPQSVDFPLEPLGLQPGQTISYWIEARDNKMPLGNRTNTAPKLNILITEPVSPEEARKQQQQRKGSQDEQVRQEQEEEQDKQEPDGQDQDDQPKDQPPESGNTDAKQQDPDTKPETNPDGKTEPGESPSGQDDKPDQRSGKPKPGDDTNDSPNEQGSDKPGDQDGGNAGDQKNEQKKNENSDSSGKPPSSSSSPQDGSPDSKDSKPGSGNPDPNAEPLNNDGSDDAEALDRVREFQSKQNDKTNSGETPDSDPNGRDPKPKPGDDNNTSSDQNSKSKTDPNTPADSNNKTGNKPKSMPPDKDSKDNGAAGQQKDKKQNKTGDADSKTNNDPSGKKNNKDTKKGERGTEPDGSKSQPKTGKGNPPPEKEQESPGGSKTKKGANGKKGEGTRPDGKPEAADKTKGGSDQKPGTAKTGSASDGDDPKKAQSGDTNSKDGNKTSGNKKPGNKNNGKKGDTNSGQKNGKKDSKPNGKQNTKSGDKQDGQGGAANKPGGKTGGKPSNKPSSKGETGKNAREGGTGGTSRKQDGNAQQGDEPGEQPNKDQSPASSSDKPDPVNQEFTKEAANLVLKRLEDEINRGDVDPELLKQLGWTKDDVSKFAARLRDSVDTPGNDNSPESQAKRRQFENLLKDIAIKSNGSKRTGRSQRTRKTNSINTQDIPVPLQFREAAKLYRRNLTSRRTTAPQRPRTTKPATSGN